jgi:hypothetical protein
MKWEGRRSERAAFFIGSSVRDTTMTLPPLYKYLDVTGAKLTLQNRTFKHAKPSDFNDLEDLTIRSIFPESNEAALQEIKDNFTDILVRNLDKAPASINHEIRQKVALIQHVYRRNPDAAEAVKAIIREDNIGDLYDLEGLRQRSEGHIKEINDLMQCFRVLCVSQNGTSTDMWTRYAQNSQGIVLRILPNASKDSKFLLFRKVEYRSTRPPLYPNVLDFLETGLFGDQEKRALDAMNNIIYSKTLEWEYEEEYRLAIPILDGADWNTMPYHPEEIPELYFGYKATDETKVEITKLAKKLNPEIKIFHGCLCPDGRLSFLR